MVKIVQASPEKDLTIQSNVQTDMDVPATASPILREDKPQVDHSVVLIQKPSQPVKPVVVPSPVAASAVTPEPVAIPEAPKPTDPVEIGKQLAAARGWTGSEWEALYQLWQHESNWRPEAVNASSGACGIVQALPCHKIPNPASVESQLAWGIAYISSVYGSPSNAWYSWQIRHPHWY